VSAVALDWVPGNRPRPGHEAEFRDLYVRLAGGQEIDFARWDEISFTAFQTLNAPMVGRDTEANDWARRLFQAGVRIGADEQDSLAKLAGLYVLDLVPACDGLPRYTSGYVGGTLEPYTFQAEALRGCADVLGAETINRGPMFPEQSLAYGQALIGRAERYAARHDLDLGRLVIPELTGGDGRPVMPRTYSPELAADIVHGAGRWCVFWAEREHIIHASE
jgi:hypothetical protein